MNATQKAMAAARTKPDNYKPYGDSKHTVKNRARIYGVSEGWVTYADKILACGNKEIIEQVDEGKLGLKKAYDIISRQHDSYYGIKGVYILSNPAFPELYKIGKSDNIGDRVAELSASSAIPFPFKVEKVIETDDPQGLETRLHRLFKDRRVGKEFFALAYTDLAFLGMDTSHIRTLKTSYGLTRI